MQRTLLLSLLIAGTAEVSTQVGQSETRIPGPAIVQVGSTYELILPEALATAVQTAVPGFQPEVFASMVPGVPQRQGPPAPPPQAAAEDEILLEYLKVVPCGDNLISSRKQGEVMRFRVISGEAFSYDGNIRYRFAAVRMGLQLDSSYLSTRGSGEPVSLLMGKTLADARRLIPELTAGEELAVDEDQPKAFRKPPSSGGSILPLAVDADGMVEIDIRLDYDSAVLYDPATERELAEFSHIKDVKKEGQE